MLDPQHAQHVLTQHRSLHAGALSTLVELTANNAGATLGIMLGHGRAPFVLKFHRRARGMLCMEHPPIACRLASAGETGGMVESNAEPDGGAGASCIFWPIVKL